MVKRTFLANTETASLKIGPALHNGQPTTNESTAHNRRVTYRTTCKFCRKEKVLGKAYLQKYICPCLTLSRTLVVFQMGPGVFEGIYMTFEEALAIQTGEEFAQWQQAGLNAWEINTNGARFTFNLTDPKKVLVVQKQNPPEFDISEVL